MTTGTNTRSLIIAALHLLRAADEMLKIIDTETAAGRGHEETAQTVAEAMTGLNFACDCVADLIEPNLTIKSKGEPSK